MNIYSKNIKLDDGRTITLETGKLAKQSDGAVVLKMGSTMLLATVVAAKDPKPDLDFMPLSVEYKEKFASLGRFPGGFLKRETRPSDYEILIARLIDRVLRPLFPKDYHCETFVNVYLISADKETQPDALAGLAASAALAVSDIPIQSPVSEVRVARIHDRFVINPAFSDMEDADIDLIVGATKDNVMMVEGEMKEVSENDMLEAIKFAHDNIKKHCQVQYELMEMVGKIKKREYEKEVQNDELKQIVRDKIYDKIYDISKKGLKDKLLRSEMFETVKKELIDSFDEINDEKESLIKNYFYEIEKEAIRNFVLNEKVRIDGRKNEEIRPIWSEVDYLPGTHGSALFTRGETQSLTTITLGSKLDEKIIDEALIQGSEKFLLHYNFPPFSTGDARPSRGISRREIGHGNLAHRAIKNIIPNDSAYTIRIVSDILESNGSSSMATVCASTLALMDAGIQIKKPVSGIAMGLISDTKTKKHAILSDILGDEDHLGDMDFKVTGTKDGITATQMDIKIDGLSYEVLSKALMQAKEGRLHILDKMLETLAETRTELKPHAPKIESIQIPKDTIGTVIGPGGKNIQELQAKTDTVIVINESENVGIVEVSGIDKENIEKAISHIKAITAKPEVGKTYKGKVKNILDFGAFVEILPGKDGLLHISEIAHHRVNKVHDYLKEGEIIEVKLIDVDVKNGKLKLSRKALLKRNQHRK